MPGGAAGRRLGVTAPLASREVPRPGISIGSLVSTRRCMETRCLSSKHSADVCPALPVVVFSSIPILVQAAYQALHFQVSHSCVRKGRKKENRWRQHRDIGWPW